MQALLQTQAYGKSLQSLSPEERAEAMRVHVLALLDEVHEVLHEVGWKPWSKKRHFNREAFVEELADALHFVCNIMLIGNVSAQELFDAYALKHAVNQERQRAGY